MEDLLRCLRKLFVGHGAIASAKINRSGLQLLDAAAAANGLIVNLNVAVCVVIFAEPFLVNGIGKGCACTVKVGLSTAYTGQSCGEHQCHAKLQFHCSSSRVRDERTKAVLNDC